MDVYASAGPLMGLNLPPYSDVFSRDTRSFPVLPMSSSLQRAHLDSPASIRSGSNHTIMVHMPSGVSFKREAYFYYKLKIAAQINVPATALMQVIDQKKDGVDSNVEYTGAADFDSRAGYMGIGAVATGNGSQMVNFPAIYTVISIEAFPLHKGMATASCTFANMTTSVSVSKVVRGMLHRTTEEDLARNGQHCFGKNYWRDYFGTQHAALQLIQAPRHIETAAGGNPVYDPRRPNTRVFNPADTPNDQLNYTVENRPQTKSQVYGYEPLVFELYREASGWSKIQNFPELTQTQAYNSQTYVEAGKATAAIYTAIVSVVEPILCIEPFRPPTIAKNMQGLPGSGTVRFNFTMHNDLSRRMFGLRNEMSQSLPPNPRGGGAPHHVPGYDAPLPEGGNNYTAAANGWDTHMPLDTRFLSRDHVRITVTFTSFYIAIPTFTHQPFLLTRPVNLFHSLHIPTMYQSPTTMCQPLSLKNVRERAAHATTVMTIPLTGCADYLDVMTSTETITHRNGEAQGSRNNLHGAAINHIQMSVLAQQGLYSDYTPEELDVLDFAAGKQFHSRVLPVPMRRAGTLVNSKVQEFLSQQADHPDWNDDFNDDIFADTLGQLALRATDSVRVLDPAEWSLAIPTTPGVDGILAIQLAVRYNLLDNPDAIPMEFSDSNDWGWGNYGINADNDSVSWQEEKATGYNEETPVSIVVVAHNSSVFKLTGGIAKPSEVMYDSIAVAANSNSNYLILGMNMSQGHINRSLNMPTGLPAGAGYGLLLGSVAPQSARSAVSRPAAGGIGVGATVCIYYISLCFISYELVLIDIYIINMGPAIRAGMAVAKRLGKRVIKSSSGGRRSGVTAPLANLVGGRVGKRGGGRRGGGRRSRVANRARRLGGNGPAILIRLAAGALFGKVVQALARDGRPRMLSGSSNVARLKLGEAERGGNVRRCAHILLGVYKLLQFGIVQARIVLEQARLGPHRVVGGLKVAARIFRHYKRRRGGEAFGRRSGGGRLLVALILLSLALLLLGRRGGDGGL